MTAKKPTPKDMLRNFDPKAPIGEGEVAAFVAGGRWLHLQQQLQRARFRCVAYTALGSVALTAHGMVYVHAQMQRVPQSFEARELLLFAADFLTIFSAGVSWQDIGKAEERILDYDRRVDEAIGPNPLTGNRGVIVMPPPARDDGASREK